MMKKEIKRIVKKHRLLLVNYNTYRSDMGCQVYEITVSLGDNSYFFCDSYFVGSGIGGEYIIKSFFKEVIKGHFGLNNIEPLDEHHQFLEEESRRYSSGDGYFN